MVPAVLVVRTACSENPEEGVTIRTENCAGAVPSKVYKDVEQQCQDLNPAFIGDVCLNRSGLHSTFTRSGYWSWMHGNLCF